MHRLAIALLLSPTVFIQSTVLAQDADLILQNGQRLPGRPPLRTVATGTVNSNGDWAALAADAPGCTGCGPLICVLNGAVVAEPGMTLASGYTLPAGGSGPIALDIAESGELLLVVSTVGTERTLVWDTWPVLSTGDALPYAGLPAGATLDSLIGARVASAGLVAVAGIAEAPGGFSEPFVARLMVTPGGIQSFELIGIGGTPIGTSSLFISQLSGMDDHDRFDLDESGDIIWTPGVTGFTEYAICVNDEPVLVHGDPGPILGSTYDALNANMSVGIGNGSWVAAIDLLLEGQTKIEVLIRDGQLKARTGDVAPSLAPGEYVGFRSPLRPLPGAGVMFAGYVGSFQIGYFDLDGHSFLRRDHIDNSRLYPTGYFDHATVSPNGRWVIERTQMGGFEGILLLDRQGTPEDPCTLSDDHLEPNDSLGQAAVMNFDTETALLVQRASPDWYSIAVPAGTAFNAQARFDTDEADVDLRLWTGDAGTPTLVAASNSASDGERVFAAHAGPGMATYWLEVSVSATSVGDCARYRLDVRSGGQLAWGIDDALEDGDRPEAPVLLGPGSYTDLRTSFWDEDWYEVEVGPGEILDVRFELVSGNRTQGWLFEDASLRYGLDGATAYTQLENLTWQNYSSEPRKILIGFQPALAGSNYDSQGFSVYDLDVTLTDPGLGTPYCPPSVNSTGLAAILQATGSPSISANSLELSSFTVPAETGIFFFGEGTNQIPLGNGTLCVSPGSSVFHRLRIDSASGGVLRRSVDFGSFPTSLITPGSTWHFQCWYRDVAGGGAGSNLSTAVSMTFTP